jgi:ferric-dicitrate binding protein FerR (iron transport regulator)
MQSGSVKSPMSRARTVNRPPKFINYRPGASRVYRAAMKTKSHRLVRLGRVCARGSLLVALACVSLWLVWSWVGGMVGQGVQAAAEGEIPVPQHQGWSGARW